MTHIGRQRCVGKGVAPWKCVPRNYRPTKNGFADDEQPDARRKLEIMKDDQKSI